jgi:hypothetical protein
MPVASGLALSFGAAHGGSPQTPASDRAQICQTRNGSCMRVAEVRMKERAVLSKASARGDLVGSTSQGNLAGSMYQGRMSGGGTWRGSLNRCPARAHSAGYG